MTEPTTNPKPITPILDPLLLLLRSRAVMVALLNILLYVLASYAGATPELLNLISILGLAIIGKMGAEDVAGKLASRPIVPAVNAGNVEQLQVPPTAPMGTSDTVQGL